MSGRKIRWTLQALRRLDEIGAHIETDNPAAAARVISRLVSAVDMLLDQPAMGRVGGGSRERGKPCFPTFPTSLPIALAGISKF